MLFGPDGTLYASTGDGSGGAATLEESRTSRAAVQDTSSLKGMILRVTASGGVPATDPFGNLVYAYGFRNVFGFDFDPINGQFWIVDNGPAVNSACVP